MSQINLFRIQENATEAFSSAIAQEYALVGNNTYSSFVSELYCARRPLERDVSWKWVFDLFGSAPIQIGCQPKALLIVKNTNSNKEYAISFGGAFFDVDRYADRDFAFDFACRIGISSTRLTATTNSNSRRNKTINSYKSFDHLEINSGESYTKIKVEINEPSAEELVGNLIEVGISVKFNLKKVSFEGIADLIAFVEQKLSCERINKIPVFSRIVDVGTISQLEGALACNLNRDCASLSFSEFDVIGTDEVFNRADSYRFIYATARKDVNVFSEEELWRFIYENRITTPEERLKIKVAFIYDGHQRYTKPVHDLIDYMDEGNKALLIAGTWYNFNQDFLDYLKQSLEEIDVVYDSRYDITSRVYDSFLGEKYEEEKNSCDFEGLEENDIRKSLRRKYYPERIFNMLCERKGFTLLDRDIAVIQGMRYELADLAKDGVLYSVKRGVGSADLTYVVAQSEGALELIKNHQLSIDKPSKMALWLIFERRNRYSIADNRLDWDEVPMLLLKVRIDAWKKSVLLAGMKPEIHVNYDSV